MATPLELTPVGVATVAGTTYYWRARTVSTGGTTSAWTTVTNFIADRPPNTPTLTGPTGSVLTLTAALSWTFSDPDAGDTQGGWAVRTSINAGAYRYWNASTGAWSATEVINNGAVIGLTIATSVGVWAWSARVADVAGALSAYPADATWTVISASVPGAPTAVTASPFNASALVAWTAPVSTGGSPILDYTVTASVGGFTGTFTTPTGNISGLTNGTAYTFTVTARNVSGSSVASAPSSTIIPVVTPRPIMPAVTVEIAFASNSATPIAQTTWTDVSRYVTGQIHTSTGRQHESSNVEAGTMSLRLLNTDGRFNPFNTASPYHGPFTDGTDTAVLGLVPMKRIRVKATWNGNTKPLWSGFIDAWPMTWPNEVLAYADITCTDAFKQLNLVSTSDVYALTVRSLAPSGWWRLGDTPVDAGVHVGTAVAVESSGSGINGLYTGASLNNQSLTDANALGTCMGTDVSTTQNMTAGGPNYAPPKPGTGAGFRTAIWSGGSFTWSCVFQRPVVTTTGFGAGIVSMLYTSPAGQAGLNVFVNGTDGSLPGGLVGILYPATSTYLAGIVQSPGRVDDSNVHHLAITYDTAASTISLFLDGVLAQSHPAPPTLSLDANWIIPMVVGYGFGGFLQEVAMWNGTVLTAAQILNLAQTALADWSGDLTSGRVVRLLAATGWSPADQSIETGQSVMQALKTTSSPNALTAGTTVLAALQTVVDTERGLFFADPAGVLRFYSRTHNLLNATAGGNQITLGEGAEPYDLSGTVLSLDDLDLWNDIGVTRRDGVTQYAVDPLSQARYGVRTLAITGDQQYDADALSCAQYLLDRFKDPTTRINAIAIHPISDPDILFQEVLALGLADRITVLRDVPGTGTNYSQTASIEWIEHTIDVIGDWHTVWKLSPTDTRQYWLLQDFTYGVLGSTTRLFF